MDMEYSPGRHRLSVQKRQHPPKARLLRVCRTVRIAPIIQRVTFGGDDLADLVSGSFDDHVKLFFPHERWDRPALPVFGPRGPAYPGDAPQPLARDYTPRRYDPASSELDIDFVLHGPGPAALWASRAKVGQYLGAAGPGSSFVIPHAVDWHLLIGDETAIPAIARRLEELPAGIRVHAIIETSRADSRQELPSRADLTLQWVSSAFDVEGGVGALQRVVRRLQLPEGEGYVWAAGEYACIRAIRQHLVRECGLDKSRIRAASYWRKGMPATHEVFAD